MNKGNDKNDIAAKSRDTRKTSVEVTTPTLTKDGYVLHEMLGEGSYSNVYRATNSKYPGQYFAVKMYKLNQKTQKWVERCLSREMHISILAKHPNIVQTYEAVATSNEAYLIIQYARNGSIYSFLKKLPAYEYLKEKKACLWLFDIFSAVSYLHNKEIAHRDIKTENFLLDENMKPLLCDFSFACLAPNSATRFDCMVDTVCGTTYYLAPEVQALKSGQKYNAKLVDVYALGVCMFEMLTKKLPFLGKYSMGDPELVQRQMKNDYSFKCGTQISKYARKLIQLMLDPNPRTRISIQKAINDEWFTRSLKSQRLRKSSSKATMQKSLIRKEICSQRSVNTSSSASPSPSKSTTRELDGSFISEM